MQTATKCQRCLNRQRIHQESMSMRKLATVAFSPAKYVDSASIQCPDSQQSILVEWTAAMQEAAGKGWLLQPPPEKNASLTMQGSAQSLARHGGIAPSKYSMHVCRISTFPWHASWEHAHLRPTTSRTRPMASSRWMEMGLRLCTWTATSLPPS